jgi:hypothetical protein
MFLDFVAYNIQNPGVKMRWAILLQGAAGCGKTFYSGLIAASLGSQHVGTPDNTVLSKDWTEWAEGKCVVCVEEIRCSGRNRFELMDKLKPYITNDVVTISRRHKDSYQIPNVTNYLMFTNHHDALVIDDSDRRYCIFKSEIQTRRQIERRGGDAYFDQLFGVFRYPGAIRRYFENRKICSTFLPNGRAPITKWRTSLIQLGKSDVQQVVEEIIDSPTPWVNSDLLSSKVLLDTINTDYENFKTKVNRRELSRVLSNMGFNMLDKRQSVKSSKHWLWVHDEADNVVKANPKQAIVDRIEVYNDIYDGGEDDE